MLKTQTVGIKKLPVNSSTETPLTTIDEINTIVICMETNQIASQNSLRARK